MTTTSYRPPNAYDAYLASLKPVAWWKLADAPGSLIARDASGNGYDGTVNGGVTFGETGPLGGTPPKSYGALFDGSTGYVQTSLIPSGSALTVLAWARITNAGLLTTQTRLMAAGGAGSQGFDVPVRGKGASISIELDTSSGQQIVSGTTDITDGFYHMSGFTYTGTEMYAYVDGVQEGETAQTGSFVATFAALLGSYTSAGDFFPGDIAQVAIFDTALTPTQIAELWKRRNTSGLYVPTDTAYTGGRSY